MAFVPSAGQKYGQVSLYWTDDRFSLTAEKLPDAVSALTAVLSAADTCTYVATHRYRKDQWEIGTGTFEASAGVGGAPSLARTAVLASSNAGNKVAFDGGIVDVRLVRHERVGPALAVTGATFSTELNAATADAAAIRGFLAEVVRQLQAAGLLGGTSAAA